MLGRANHEQLLLGWPTAGLTTVGRIYYYQHYAANVAAHPEVVARLEQLDEQARELVHAPPAGVFAEWLWVIQTGFSVFPP